MGEALGGSPVPSQANEFAIGERRVAIKTARATTNSVGVTYLTLDRVDDVYGAWESEIGAFEVWCLPVAVFKEHMRPTASKGASAGKVGLVSQSILQERGRRLGTVCIRI